MGNTTTAKAEAKRIADVKTTTLKEVVERRKPNATQDIPPNTKDPRMAHSGKEPTAGQVMRTEPLCRRLCLLLC